MTPAHPPDARNTVLVVDDSGPFRSCIRAVLSPFGWDIEEACDGASALALILDKRFDLLITDLQMSPVGGAELVMAVRRLPPDRRPLMIICSADHDSTAADVVQARRHADCVVAKPISAARLAAAALTLIDQRR